MLSALTWLMGSKAGRITVAVLLTCASVALAFWQAYRSGAASEKAKQQQVSLDALRSRISSDDQISKMSPDARRAELARWMQRDDDSE